MEYFLDLFIAGLIKGSIYALIALGYTMVYGVLGLINFAHGEIYMIGAFTGLVASGVLITMELNAWAVFALVLVFAAVYAGAYGYTMEKIAYQPLRHAPRLSPLISAIGMSIFLQNYVLLAQGPEFQAYPSLVPEMPFLEQWSEFIQPSDLMILFMTVLVMILLSVLTRHTRMGMAMRAISQDKKMAMLLGVDLDKTISFTFILGSMLAAIGGVLVATRVGQINFYIGFIAGIKAFTAAVLGGIGNIPGAVLGGLILGWTESFAAGYISSDYEDVFAFALLVIILIFKPAGLLGRETREKV
ncbi:MAG: branched-chain amino acid ABC transporter permease LivH [SAR324 cluster bacterium]|nr:branched-chain amino acid ABC transporter permease LivH [SAR324 cluster bacterium]MBF0351627.1 branched-chain amino acid ABC transporter permease LivH [SAR324 cluster bacterium]